MRIGQWGVLSKVPRKVDIEDTVFLIVADHDNRIYGDNLIPVEKFHIPGLILGADIEAARLSTLSSQIDLTFLDWNFKLSSNGWA